jgi:hypothetical protein
MIYFLTLITCLFTSPLVAEIIGNVEYQLPKGWVIKETSIEEDDNKTITYIQESPPEETSAIFHVIANNHAGEAPDQEALAAFVLSLAEVYGNENVKILENDTQSVLFELSMGDEDIDMGHLIRGFFSEQGTVILSYLHVERSGLFAANRDLWLKILKEAKQVQ